MNRESDLHPRSSRVDSTDVDGSNVTRSNPTRCVTIVISNFRLPRRNLFDQFRAARPFIEFRFSLSLSLSALPDVGLRIGEPASIVIPLMVVFTRQTLRRERPQLRLTSHYSRDPIIVTRRMCTETTWLAVSRVGIRHFHIRHVRLNVKEKRPIGAIRFPESPSGRSRAHRMAIIPGGAFYQERNFVRHEEGGPADATGSQSFTSRFHLGSLCNFPARLSLSPQITRAILVGRSPARALASRASPYMYLALALSRLTFSRGHNVSEE